MTDTPPTVEARFRQILRDQLEVTDEQIKPSASLIEDLGADSLGLVEVTLAAEDAFDLDIPDEDIEQIRTVGEAVAYLEAHAR